MHGRHVWPISWTSFTQVLPAAEPSRCTSFDFVQQVHLPSNPLQPGSLYFLVPRKVGLFEVCCEGIPKQVNYIIDEAHLISKGSHAVVSYLHHFFESFGLGETDAQLHCDNCSGQNKNPVVLCMEGMHWSSQVHLTQLFDCRTHEICTRQMFWVSQTGIQTPCCVVSGGI